MYVRDSVLRSRHFEARSDFGRIEGNVSLDFRDGDSGNDLKRRIMGGPIKGKLGIKDVDLSKIPVGALDFLKLGGEFGGDFRFSGSLDSPQVESDFRLDSLHIMGEDIHRIDAKAGFSGKKVSVESLGIEMSEGEGSVFRISDVRYDLARHVVAGEVVLDPISIQRFAMFREMDLDMDAQLSADIRGEFDLDTFLKSGKVDEGFLDGRIGIDGLRYGTMQLGDSSVVFSQSAPFIIVKGDILGSLELRGFFRLAPVLTASVAVDFLRLDVLELLIGKGVIEADFIDSMGLSDSVVSGSAGFCYVAGKESRVSLFLDDFDVNLGGRRVSLQQTARFSYDLMGQRIRLSSFDVAYGHSRLMASGDVGLDGKVDFDVNGELDVGMLSAFFDFVQGSEGVISLSLGARGSFMRSGQFDFKDLKMEGFVGVRNPIVLKTSFSREPLVLSQGLLVLGEGGSCRTGSRCLFSPDETPFRLDIEGKSLDFSLYGSDDGAVDLGLKGHLNAVLAEQIPSVINEARGILGMDLRLTGNFLNKGGHFSIDPGQFELSGFLGIEEGVHVRLRALTSPLSIDSGRLRVASGSDCTLGSQCFVISRDDAFSGQALDGSFQIFGEFQRDSVLPKRGSLSFIGNHLGYRMKDELAATVSADLNFTVGDISRFGSYLLSGNVEINDVRYSKNFDSGSNLIKDKVLALFVDARKRSDVYESSFLRKLPQLGEIMFDVNVRADNSIKVDVKIAGVSVDLGLGTQLYVGGNLKTIRPTGFLTLFEGNVDLRKNLFEFQPGGQVTFNNSLDGKIDISATAEINTSSSAFSSVFGASDMDRRKRIRTSELSRGSEFYVITLNLGGSVFKPSWAFDSSPYLNDANIYALLFTCKTIDEFGNRGNEESPAMDIALGSIVSPFFESQLDTFLKADEFKFLFTEGAAQFVYMKRLSRNLRLAAGVSIRGAEGNEQALSGEYFFNDWWSMDITGQNTVDEVGKAPTFKLGSRLRRRIPLGY